MNREGEKSPHLISRRAVSTIKSSSGNNRVSIIKKHHGVNSTITRETRALSLRYGANTIYVN